MDTEIMYRYVLELIRATSSDLPPDVEDAIRKARAAEKDDSRAASILDTIIANVPMARARSTPICQDTGTLNFFVRHPKGASIEDFADASRKAAAEATRLNYLRPNAVHPVTGKNTGDNVGIGSPNFHFESWESSSWQVDLLLKGGGSENVSAQFKLPDQGLKAGRDLEGVRRVVLKAVVDAQGQGCAPGILGVSVGGDRAVSFANAKKQLLRPLTDRNPDEKLAALESRIVEEANALGIGPMGLGGGLTLLGCKIGVAHRHPASFFVSVAYLCWAARRRRMSFDSEGMRIEETTGAD